MAPFGGSGSSGSGETGYQQTPYDARSNLGFGRPEGAGSSQPVSFGSGTFSQPSDPTLSPNAGRVQNYGYEQNPSGSVGVADPYYPGAKPTFPTDPRYPIAGQVYGQTAGEPFTREYQFSAEEMRVVKECTKESFWYRSLPFSTALAGLTHVGVRKGYLTPSAKYGSLPKVAFASVFGFILGKISYWKECQEKFLRLPESKLGDAIRRRQAGKTGQQFPAPSDYGQKVYEGAYPTNPAPGQYSSGSISSQAASLPSYTPKKEQSSAMNSTDDYQGELNIDTDSSRYMLDIDDKPPSIFDFDSAREKKDRNTDGGLNRTANYDELRRQHRDAYMRPPSPNSGQDVPPRRSSDF